MKKTKTNNKETKVEVKPVQPEFAKPKVAKAIARFVRIQPRKLRLVLDSVRTKPVYQAFAMLATIKKKGARLMEKVLKSAVANAKVLGMDEQKLIVSSAFADGGPSFKRFRTRSMGRADRVLKRTAHLTVAVSEGHRTFTQWQAPGVMISQEAGGKVKAKKVQKAGAAKAGASK